MGSCLSMALTMADEVDLEDLLAALSAEELSNLVDEMAADPDDKHMPASVRTAYRCEKDPTGDLNRDSLINHINEIALNTPDKEEKVKFEPGVKRGKVYVPVYNEAQEAMGLRVEERIANAICKNPRIMKAGITLEFKEVITRVSKHMIANMDKLRTNRLKDGVQPGSGALWVKAKTID